eukprot:GFYU01001855.1.p1 GENE.GFYU01001855.1~~GFYU01001855.1.p1  ORF type:complete len:409 (+),score=146.55 GFYU01001855.1:98-1228(+)
MVMKIEGKKISVVGVGRLGICVALCFERAGYDVLGVDIFPKYVEAINNKTLQSDEPRVMEFLASSKNFRATTSLDEAVEHSDVIMVFVHTPNGGGEKFYDHSHLNRVLMQLNDRKIQNKHVIVGCTVIPGYCNDVGSFLLRDCPNTTLTYHPEFIAQGDIVKGFLRPDMVLIGEGDAAIGDFMEQLYRDVCENEPYMARMSPSSAEITKLAVNCFITTKISYANMIGDIADKTPGADKFKILSAVGSDARVGRKCLMPGYGFGGPCFPRDNRALGGYAEQIGCQPLIPTATDEYNKIHTKIMAQELLDQNLDAYVFDDIAYKEKCPVPIIEESQKLVIAKTLAMAGKKVTLKDRKSNIQAAMQEFGRLFNYEIVEV